VSEGIDAFGVELGEVGIGAGVEVVDLLIAQAVQVRLNAAALSVVEVREGEAEAEGGLADGLWRHGGRKQSREGLEVVHARVRAGASCHTALLVLLKAAPTLPRVGAAHFSPMHFLPVFSQDQGEIRLPVCEVVQGARPHLVTTWERQAGLKGRCGRGGSGRDEQPWRATLERLDDRVVPAERSGDAVRFFLLRGLVGAVERKAVWYSGNAQDGPALQVHRGCVTLLTR